MKTVWALTGRVQPSPVPDGLPVTPRFVLAHSSTEFSRWLADRRRHHPTVAPLHVISSYRQTVASLATNLLVGLGKRDDLATMKRPAEHVAAAWLLEGAATDVLLYEAQKLPLVPLTEVLVWLCGLGVTPWVVATSAPSDGTHAGSVRVVTNAVDRIAKQWGAPVEDRQALEARFPDVPAPSEPATHGDQGGLPVLPRCSGIVFRQVCKNLFTPEMFEVVDERFVALVQRLRVEAADVLGRPDRQKGRLLAPFLRAELDKARDTEEAVLFAAAAEAALLPLSWHVTVDRVRLVTATETRVLRGMTDPGVWERLGTYRDPDYGAATALLLAGFDVEALPDLTVGDVTVGDDGSVEVAGEAIGDGSWFIQVLRTYQMIVSPDGDGRLFTTHRNDHVRPQFIHGLVNTPIDEVGADAVDRSRQRVQLTDRESLRQFGITFEYLKGRAIK